MLPGPRHGTALLSAPECRIAGGSAQPRRPALTQKVPAPEGRPGLISTTYLNLDEYHRLATLPAAVLRKTRYSVPPFGIDAYAAPLGGLFIAEVEFEDDVAMRAFKPPSWTIAEVTLDSRFTGGHFVTMRAEDLADLLAAFGLNATRCTQA